MVRREGPRKRRSAGQVSSVLVGEPRASLVRRRRGASVGAPTASPGIDEAEGAAILLQPAGFRNDGSGASQGVGV